MLSTESLDRFADMPSGSGVATFVVFGGAPSD